MVRRQERGHRNWAGRGEPGGSLSGLDAVTGITKNGRWDSETRPVSLPRPLPWRTMKSAVVANTAAITTIPEMNSEHGALPYRRRWVIVRAASGAQGVAVHPRFWRGKNPRTTQVGFSDPPVVGNCGGVWTPESRETLGKCGRECGSSGRTRTYNPPVNRSGPGDPPDATNDDEDDDSQ